MLIFYLFLLGLLLGSFYNVVGLRLPKGELFKEERSYCPYCRKTLKWYELVPLLSYFHQRGKCRYCQSPISFIYPAMELISGLMFAFCIWYVGLQLELVLALLLISLFLIITVSDLVYMIIPDKLLLFFFILFLIYRCFQPLEPWWSSLLGGVIGIGMTAFIILISKGGMGGGDMKLFGLIGFVLGWKLLLVTFFLSTLLGSITSGFLLIVRVISKNEPFPFGPFIVVGASFSYF
ncbi:prepilin peptidase, partial [Halobacillus sp. BBL2006]